MKKSLDNKKQNNITIELLPEFGWQIEGQSVFGPGSTLQGIVKLTISNKDVVPTAVRLSFIGTEMVPAFELSPGVLRYTKKTLFNIQRNLWDSKDKLLSLQLNQEHSFMFTIQIPMVQYPPSIDQDNYKCCFKLVAKVDTLSTLPSTTTELPVVFMPLIETRLTKPSLCLRIESQKSYLLAKINLDSERFVLNDKLNLGIRVELDSSRKRPNTLHYATVTVKLIQTIKVVAFDGIPDSVCTLSSVSYKLPLFDSQNNLLTTDAQIQLPVPLESIPSLDFSQIASVTHHIKVTVEQKANSIKFWNDSLIDFKGIPIVIGTLGYGIKNSAELQLYYKNSNAKPIFLEAIEYKDTLPLYEASKLPRYTAIHL